MWSTAVQANSCASDEPEGMPFRLFQRVYGTRVYVTTYAHMK
jgi:hypothetical protein